MHVGAGSLSPWFKPVLVMKTAEIGSATTRWPARIHGHTTPAFAHLQRIPCTKSCHGFQAVLMMEPAQHRPRDDSKADRLEMTVHQLWGLLTTRIWDARSQARMRASMVVVSDPFCDNGPDMTFI